MAQILLAYRQEDASYGERLYLGLVSRLHEAHQIVAVALTTPTISDEALALTDLVVVVIGATWEERRGNPSRSSEVVFPEVADARRCGKVVIPVLVGMARNPRTFPQTHQELRDLTLMAVRDEDWERRVEGLARTVAHAVPDTSRRVTRILRYSEDFPVLKGDLQDREIERREAELAAEIQRKQAEARALLLANMARMQHDMVTTVMANMGIGAGRVPPSPSSDALKCSVFAPSAARAGDAVLVQVFAHLPADDESVRNLAAAYDASTSARAAKLLSRPIARGTSLTFSLSTPGALVDDSVQTLIWEGVPEAVQFGVTIPQDRRAGNLIGTVTVSDGTVPFGHVKFVMQVVGAMGELSQASREEAEQTWTRYRHAFISYASADRVEVLKRVQMLERTGIDFFQDLLSLDPGERWERTLYRKIDESDVFFLFWSTAAKNSEWVRKEVRYALERHAGNAMAPPEIVPVIIEGPPPVAPPPELSELHFNERFLYFIAGSTSQQP